MPPLRPLAAARPCVAGTLQLSALAGMQAIRCYEQCMRLCPTSPNAFQNRLLALNYVHGGEEPHVSAAHAEWGAAFAAQVPPLPPPDRAMWPPLAGRRLRVGYISPDLYRHSVSYFAEAPLRCHDRSRVEVRVRAPLPPPRVSHRHHCTALHQ